jgi:hypothetical protein
MGKCTNSPQVVHSVPSLFLSQRINPKEADWGEATEAIGKKLGTGPPPSLIHHSKRSTDGADEDDFDDKRRRNNKGGHYRLENSI